MSRHNRLGESIQEEYTCLCRLRLRREPWKVTQRMLQQSERRVCSWFARLRTCLGSLVVLLFLSGCNRDSSDARLLKFPVQGIVMVGRFPADLLRVEARKIDQREGPAIATGVTDAKGFFQLSTFISRDGLPPGEYVLTFDWRTIDSEHLKFSGEDRLQGNYSNPKDSEHLLEVANDPIDLGIIKLALPQ